MEFINSEKKYIIFEGIDGTGKSSLSKQLYNYLKRKYRTKVIREPGSTKLAEKLRKIISYSNLLPQTQLFLFLAARSETYNKMNDLSEEIIIMDRSFLSTYAYQSVLLQLSFEKLNTIHSIIRIPMKKALVFVLSAPPNVISNRLDKNNIFHEILSKQILKEIDKQYRRLSKIFKCYRFIYLDATCDLNYLYNRILKYSDRFLNNKL